MRLKRDGKLRFCLFLQGKKINVVVKKKKLFSARAGLVSCDCGSCGFVFYY